jgi:hypothetical protein
VHKGPVVNVSVATQTNVNAAFKPGYIIRLKEPHPAPQDEGLP